MSSNCLLSEHFLQPNSPSRTSYDCGLLNGVDNTAKDRGTFRNEVLEGRSSARSSRLCAACARSCYSTQRSWAVTTEACIAPLWNAMVESLFQISPSVSQPNAHRNLFRTWKDAVLPAGPLPSNILVNPRQPLGQLLGSRRSGCQSLCDASYSLQIER